MVEVKIRQATKEDYNLIKDFLIKNYPNDYTLKLIEEWLEDDKGKILLAIKDQELVGFSHIFVQSNKVAWFEAARVKQDMKGKGIGTMLNLEGINYCKSIGITKARLVTSSTNIVAQRHLAKTPFRPFARWIEWDFNSVFFDKANLQKSLLKPEYIYEFLLNRSCFEESGKVYQDSYIWFDLNLDWLKSMCEYGNVYFDGNNIVIIKSMNRWPNYLQTCYVDIHDENASKLIAFINSYSEKSGMKYEKCIVFSPKCGATLKALLTSSLKIKEEYIIYEANIR